MKFLLLLAALSIGVASATTSNQTRFEDKSFWKKLGREVSLSYYVALMGPSPGLEFDQTYNVFVEGNSPHQTFHSVNLRWQFHEKWAVGLTLAGIHHHTSPVKTKQGFVNDNTRELFNSRVYLATPGLDLGFAKMFNNFAVELPTTVGSRANGLDYGLVLSQTVVLKLPPSRMTVGWLTQLIRYEYEQSTLPSRFAGFSGTPQQTTLLTTGPFLNFQLAEQWQIASLLSFDWDQRGNQTDTLEFNNNLPDRARLAINYFFKTAPFTHVGLYTQTITKPALYNTILGLDFSMSI